MATQDEIIRYVYEVTGDKELRDAAKTLLETGTNSEDAAAQVAMLGDEFKRLAEAKSAVDSVVSLKAALKETGDNLALAKLGLAELNAEFSETDRSSAKINSAFSKAEKAVADLSAKEQTLQLQLEKSNGIVAKHGLDVEKLGAAEQELAKRSAEAATKVAELAKQAEKGGRFTRALQAATEAGAKGFALLRDGVNQVGGALLRITGIAGAVGSALASISATRLFGGAVTSATEFEAALSQVRAVSGATTEQMERMRVASEDASKSTTFSSLQAAGALGELARASGDADAAISQLGPTLNLAQAAGIGASESAAILTTTLTQFGLSAEDATRVADLFAREANSTQDDVTQLGNAMSYAAPLARQLGVSLEDTTAILGALADQGFRGERAGTALRNTFAQIIDPASAFRTELNALGIKTTNFTEIITELSKAGNRSQAALLALGDRAGPAITSLVTTGGAGIQRLTDDFRNAAGEAERTAKIMAENFSGASSRLTNAFDAMRRALVDPILDPLAKQFDEVAVKIRAFAETAQFERIKNSVRDFALGATDAIVRFVSSINFDNVAAAIEGFANSSKEFFTSIKENASAVGTALSVVGGVIKTLFNGIQTVILGVAAASTAGLALMLKSAELTAEGVARLAGNYEQLKPIFDSVNEKIGGLAAVAGEFGRRAAENGRETKDAFVGLANSLSDTKSAADGAKGSVDGLAKPLQLSAEQAERLRAEFAALPEHLQKMVEPGLRAQGVFDKIAGSAPAAADGVRDTADALENAKSAAATAYNELARLSGAGDTTSSAFRAAQVALANANAEVARLSGVSQQAAAAANELADAQGRLGKTQAQLSAEALQAGRDLNTIYGSFQTGTSAIEDVRASFDKYASALRASVANSDEWKQRSVENVIAVKAASLGIQDIKGPDFTAGNTAPLTQGLQQVRESASAASAGLQQVEKQSGETAEGVGSAAQAIQNIYSGFANELGKTSQAAIVSFTELTRDLFELSAGIADFSGLARFGKAAQDAFDIVSAKIEQQKIGVAGMSVAYAEMSDAALLAAAKTRGGFDQVADGLANAAAEARAGRSEFDLLGTQDLSQLSSALDAAAQRTRQLGEEAANAKRELADLASSYQDQIDQIEGNQDSIELRRHERELARIKERAEATGNANSSEYNDAVAAESRLHDLKMRNIRREEEASRNANSSTSSSSPRRSGDASGGQGTGTSNAATFGNGGIAVNINLGGQTVTVRADSQAEVNRLIDMLRRAALSSGGGGAISG